MSALVLLQLLRAKKPKGTTVLFPAAPPQDTHLIRWQSALVRLCTNCQVFSLAAMFAVSCRRHCLQALALFPFEFLKTYFGKNRSNVGFFMTEQL
jgi:hypothetical protein